MCLWCRKELSCDVHTYVDHCYVHLIAKGAKDKAIGIPRKMVSFQTCQCQELDTVALAFHEAGVEHQCWEQLHWHPVWDCSPVCPRLLRLMSLLNPFHSLNMTTVQLLAQHLYTERVRTPVCVCVLYFMCVT